MTVSGPPNGWRAMQASDLAEVVRICAVVHAGLAERVDVFADRMQLFPDGCLVTEGGYAVAHPVRRHAPPPLDTMLGALAADADTLHIHDVTLLAHRRGGGLGSGVAAYFLDLAARARLPYCSLVAIEGKAEYWARFGFIAGVADVASYGAGACYMERPTAPR